MNFQKANSAHLPRARDQISSKYCMRAGMCNNEVCLCDLMVVIHLGWSLLTIISSFWHRLLKREGLLLMATIQCVALSAEVWMYSNKESLNNAHLSTTICLFLRDVSAITEILITVTRWERNFFR